MTKETLQCVTLYMPKCKFILTKGAYLPQRNSKRPPINIMQNKCRYSRKKCVPTDPRIYILLNLSYTLLYRYKICRLFKSGKKCEMMMKNLRYHFPICYAYSIQEPTGELKLKRALAEDTGVFSSFFYLLHWVRQPFLGIPPFISDPGSLCLFLYLDLL